MPRRSDKDKMRKEILDVLVQYIEETGRTPSYSRCSSRLWQAGISVRSVIHYFGRVRIAFEEAIEEYARRYQ